jgi:zinc protease
VNRRSPVSRTPLGIFQGGDVEQLAYANGVRALIWPTTNEPGRATVRVRFGSGLQGFADDEAAYIQLGKAALVSSGIGPLGQNELDRLATGRKLGLSFTIEDGTFVFEGLTRGSDVADQIYLFAAKLGMPRWDAAPVERAKATLLLAYDTYGGDPNGMINRDLDWLLHDRDPRFATPTPEAMRQTTPEGFKQVWSRLLAQGPIEVDVFETSTARPLSPRCRAHSVHCRRASQRLPRCLPAARPSLLRRPRPSCSTTVAIRTRPRR